MSEMLEKVNPGLKSRVSDVIDFPDFDAASASDLTRQMLTEKRLALPAELTPTALERWTRRLAAAPQWANGRDVETFVRRVAVECATRNTTIVTPAALDAALRTLLQMKGDSAAPPSASAAAALAAAAAATAAMR